MQGGFLRRGYYRERQQRNMERRTVMKIAERNGFFSVSLGATDSGDNTEKTTQHKKGKNLSIFAGNLGKNGSESPVEKKRKEVRERAAKVLMDKFESDQKYEQGLDESRARIEEAQNTEREARENLKQAQEKRDAISKEDNPEEYERYSEYIANQESILQGAESAIMGENAFIRGAKRDKLGEKYSMANAVVEEEKILAAGSKEIMGAAVQESMEHIQDQYQDNIEKAQEQKEKKEEEQEKLDELKEKRKEQEQQLAAAKAEAAEKQVEMTEQANETITKGSADVERELRTIQKQAELLDEEMKGLMVDSKL